MFADLIKIIFGICNTTEFYAFRTQYQSSSRKYKLIIILGRKDSSVAVFYAERL